MFEFINFEGEERTAVIKINRPDKLNALNISLLSELREVIRIIRADDNFLAAVITGTGEKAFVAGADITEINKLDSVTGKGFAENGQEVFNLIENLEKPVIAAINGFALGGGCELALACHIRIASENAKFGQPEVNLGIIPGYGGTQRLTRIINPGRALYYILTGEMIDAAEAERIGLISRIYPQGELVSRALELAGKIIGKGPFAVKMALRAVMEGRGLPLQDGLKLEADLFSRCCGTPEFREGTQAFLEKRKPDFR